MHKEEIKSLFEKLQKDNNYTTDEIKLVAQLINHYIKFTIIVENNDIKDFNVITKSLIKTDIDKLLNRYKNCVYLLNKKEPNLLLQQYMKNEVEKLKTKLSN